MIWFLLSIALLATGALVQPETATCPSRWWVNGARPDGRFSCRPAPLGDDSWTPRSGERDTSVQPPGELELRLYCQPGTQPRVLGPRTVGCV